MTMIYLDDIEKSADDQLFATKYTSEMESFDSVI